MEMVQPVSSSSTQRMLSTRGRWGDNSTKRFSKSCQSSYSTTDDSNDEEIFFHIVTQTSVLSSGPIATFFSLLGQAVVRILEARKRAVDDGIDAVTEEYEDEDELLRGQ